MGQTPACRTTVGDRGPDQRLATRSHRLPRDPATRPRPRGRGRPRGVSIPILLGLSLACAGCGPDDGGQAMLDGTRPMLDGAPPSGRRASEGLPPGADPRLAGMVEMLARDRELIGRGLTSPEARRDGRDEPDPTADPRRAPSSSPAPTSARTPAPTLTPNSTSSAGTVPPPRWNQSDPTEASAGSGGARERRSPTIDYSIDPPSLAGSSERRRRAPADPADERDTADRVAAAVADVLAEDRDADSPWLDDADRRAPSARPGPDLDRRADVRDPAALASPERSLPAESVAVARADLMLALMVDAIDHPDRALPNALLAALGTVGDPAATLDPSMFRQVPEADHDLVEAFAGFAAEITPAITGTAAPEAATAGDSAASPGLDADGSTIDRDALLAAIDQLRSRVARTPQLAIQRAALCRQVDGFGVFEPLATPHRFLAGRPNAFIVYVEVDEFHSEQRDGRDWVTELEQRVQIYNDRDARPVWATDWSEVVDVNANRRRDFFTAQIIELPDAFSLGVFHLKIQVRDSLTGAEAETSIEFEMVAGGSGLPLR